MNLKSKIIKEDMKNWFSIKLSKERSVSKHISNNIRSSINSGMRTSFRHKKRTRKHLENLRIDTLKRLREIDKFLKKNYQ